MGVAIVGILATLAVGTYQLYVIRGQLAQTLTDYDHIRSVVGIESRIGSRFDLQQGSVSGEVPPALGSLLERREFNQRDGMTLQLVRAPGGTFEGFPDDTYALIASAPSDAGMRRLRLLRAVLPHSEGDKLWLSASALYFPLDLAPGGDGGGTPATPGGGAPGGSGSSEGPGTPAPTEPPTTPVTPPVAPPITPPPVTPPVAPPVTPPATGGGTGWNDAQATPNGPAWDAAARVCIGGTDGNLLAPDLNAQAQIRVVQEVRTWDGQTTQRSWLTQAPIVNGCASFSQTGSPTAAPGVEGVTAIRFEVVDVIYYWPADPAVKWDGAKPVQVIKAPT